MEGYQNISIFSKFWLVTLHSTRYALGICMNTVDKGLIHALKTSELKIT